MPRQGPGPELLHRIHAMHWRPSPDILRLAAPGPLYSRPPRLARRNPPLVEVRLEISRPTASLFWTAPGGRHPRHHRPPPLACTAPPPPGRGIPRSCPADGLAFVSNPHWPPASSPQAASVCLQQPRRGIRYKVSRPMVSLLCAGLAGASAPKVLPRVPFIAKGLAVDMGRRSN